MAIPWSMVRLFDPRIFLSRCRSMPVATASGASRRVCGRPEARVGCFLRTTPQALPIHSVHLLNWKSSRRPWRTPSRPPGEAGLRRAIGKRGCASGRKHAALAQELKATALLPQSQLDHVQARDEMTQAVGQTPERLERHKNLGCDLPMNAFERLQMVGLKIDTKWSAYK